MFKKPRVREIKKEIYRYRETKDIGRWLEEFKKKKNLKKKIEKQVNLATRDRRVTVGRMDGLMEGNVAVV